MISQKQNIDIIHILNSFESTIHNYKRLLKKLQKNLAYVFQLATVKLVTVEIDSSDEDGEPIYQNQNVHFYSREKRREDHVERVVLF